MKDREGLERLFKEGFDLRGELSIDDSSMFTLNEELKRQSVLAAEFLILHRIACKQLNELEQTKELLIARIIRKICNDATEAGKPIASSAKAQLIKTDIPLYDSYRKVTSQINEAQENVNFLKSLQYIISKRGELLQDINKMDRKLIKDQMVIDSDRGFKAKYNLFEKQMKQLTKNDPKLEKILEELG